ncbi:beta-1,4-N-acetylgalactosaminyltransferase bre-4-like [Plodia interpunctella]|uniref:beta-1,4-N-acetylgalactosaminyltransferase bre-4-like n=1 Tax=Plodia interpunctella TaxID=58824 RepID=UPI0023677E62|nr:beta-1,4-N-acetylgalactosaminyltransferase bre-4-like [Plodia interpunctella]XP_053611195.1 beta-1,4-N-acetylgalactosaminyltransferase bre-4-like [Plodia interpunctella]
MGATSNGGGGRAARALRLLLLAVLALAAVEYLFGSILDASPLRTYLYTPAYNATQPIKITEKSSLWPKKLPSTAEVITENPTIILAPNATAKSSSENTTTSVANITAQNMTRLNASERPSPLPGQMETNVNFKGETYELNQKEPVLPLCELPSDLGPISLNKSDMKLEMVEKKYPEVHWGGRYSPPNCTAKHKVAIIVPFRDRKKHLAIFLNHMHPFLMKQRIEYGIFIIEQEGYSEFNRAKLMNVGYVESQKEKAGGWQCFVFHDIDLLPLDLRNIYSCPRQPRHMSASIDKLKFQLPYEDLFGGVSALTKEQFWAVNGFSNKYWGWGGEDDDMAYRVKKMGYHVARYKMSIARYAMLDHKKSAPNPKRYQLLSQTSKMFHKDGLSTLEYELVQTTHHHLYTHVLVNIDEHS